MPGPRDVVRPCAQARAEFIRPLVGRFENDATAFAMDQHFLLSRKTALLGKTNRLTAPVLEHLRARTLHWLSIYVRLYTVNGSFCPPAIHIDMLEAASGKLRDDDGGSRSKGESAAPVRTERNGPFVNGV